MAKQITKPSQYICADCGGADPNWASINRGILICDECCTVHRGLGRHISQIKSLTKSVWCPSQLQMVYDLYSNGSNSIWEHTLLDPQTGKSGGKKKPTAKDPLHPNKSDFIRAKHQNLAFINKSNKEESEADISEQLHSSVRTPNLKTSLRLLAAGANPNYIHNEKFNSSLHMATKSCQMSQIELLLVYGANPSLIDARGKTPIEYAKEANFNEIADRLIECQYELTDRLTYFLCHRSPDHKKGQHFLISELVDKNNKPKEGVEAKLKLQALSNRTFEELSRDVYDEVDRREIEVIWSNVQNLSSNSNIDKHSVPFLPVCQEFSATRNQGRQKLATLNSKEFATLIIDILAEIRKRFYGITTDTIKSSSTKQKSKKSVENKLKKLALGDSEDDDSEPLYDSVPSEDEEFSEITSKDDSKEAINKTFQSSSKSSLLSNNSKQEKQNHEPVFCSTPVSVNEYSALKDQLSHSDNLIQELVSSNKDMRHEMTRLQIMVEKLIDENARLRAVVIPISSDDNCGIVNHNQDECLPPPTMPRTVNKYQVNRPQSMYEKPSPPIQTTPSSNSMASLNTISNSSSQFNNCISLSGCGDPQTNQQANLTVPNRDEILKKTYDITKSIQELFAFAQEGNHQYFELCSDKINLSVSEMISIFPQSVMGLSSISNGDEIFLALRQLHSAALNLKIDCRSFNPSLQNQENQDVRALYQQVIQRAYDIAKAAKLVVTLSQ